MDDSSELGTADSGVESISSNDVIMNVTVSIPDLKLQKCLQFNQEETVWKAKQQMLSSFAKDLKNGFNYGFYCPPMNGKAGKFLDEERLLKEYLFNGSNFCLEFKMKRKVYKSISITAKRSKQLHSKGNLRQLMDHVKRMENEKVMKLLNKGMDPNFIESESGETPMTLACVTSRPSATIVTLVGGGAHLDFRNRKGLTPLHVAAQNGNETAIKILLDLGSSTNYKDLRGLTPLYLGVCNNNNTSARCTEMLLYDHSAIDTVDECGWTELHQACKAGRVQHVELLIYYGADLNRQNGSGNTPLHISVINNQEECARSLMFRGADRSIVNHAAKDAYQCAVVSGNSRLALEIKNFSNSDAVPYKDAPRYNEKRRSVHHHQFPVGTLKRCRSNPLMNCSTNYETVGDLDFAAQDCNLWSRRRPADGWTTASKKKEEEEEDIRRSTLIGDRFAAEPPPWKVFNPVGNPDRSFSVSSAESSQEGEVILEQKKLEDLRSKGSGTRQVFLRADSTDFGFILRGARADKVISSKADLTLSPWQPALQYFEHVKANSLADEAGIRPGDFLLEVNGVDVSSAPHEYAVSLIRNSVQTLQMLIITPTQCPSHDANSIDSRNRINSIQKELKSSLSLKTFSHPNPTWTSESNFSEPKVASIRSVHGKRLAHDLPGEDPDSVRVVSIPPYNSNSISRKLLWKAKSVHNLPGSDDICYMFDDDDNKASAADASNPPTLFGIFGLKDGRGEIEKKSFDEKPLLPNQKGSNSMGPAFKKIDQKLSSFFPPPNHKLQKDLKPSTQSKVPSTRTTPPLPPPPPSDLHNLCDPEHKDPKKPQDLDFLTLAENARQVFLKHQQTTVTSETIKLTQIDSQSKDDHSDDHSIPLKNRYAMEPYAMYNTTREISKLALVSNRRQIFESNSDKSGESDRSHNVGDVKNKDIFVEKSSRKHPIPPKPLQKPSHVFQSNIPHFLQKIPTCFPNPKSQPNLDVTKYADNITSQLPRLPEPVGLANLSLDSEDSEILFVPPPPGFEDEVEETLSLTRSSDHPQQTSPQPHGSQSKRLTEAMDKWTVDDVGDWLESMNMGEHRKTFSQNCVDGRKLSTLGRNDLINLGVLQVGQRMGLERAVKKILISYSSS